MPATLRTPSTGPRSTRTARLARAVRVLALGAVLVALALVAGLATTAAWPTTVQTRQYAATVNLSPDPSRATSVHVPTVFGDLDIDFDSWLPAPGIEASVQVRDSIASVLASSGVDVRSLQPTPEELDAAGRSAATSLGLKLLVGIVVSLLLAWLVLRGIGNGLGGRLLVPVSGLVSVALVVASLGLTYRSAAFSAVRTTGLLSLVRANAGLLGDVEKRSEQATPYVRNMLALSAAVQERYSPPEVTGSGSLKIIAVSDVHGMNQYPLLKNLVESEGAQAVIDTGDLINFGSVQEAQAAGLFAGIESLGVPYLFVRGNHDASSPTDDALVQRLRKVKNVIVLEPEREKQYTLASVGGLRIAGFGDPRWFGDGGANTAEAQKPAVAAFRAAMEALRDGSAQTDAPGDQSAPLDLVLGHEPSAVRDLADLGRVRLNGHLHSQSLDGSRIALGSFSGGGVVSHYIQSADGSELAGQPFTFDVLAFGSSCRLSTLTRYQFNDLLEGRPTYDSVQVFNGAAIQTSAPEAGRTCSNLEPTQTWTVSAPAAKRPAAPSTTPTVAPSLPSGSPTPTRTETRTPTPIGGTTSPAP